MSDAEDSEEETAEPAVELGSGPAVEGAPVARIAARFQWGREMSAIVAREGETPIRTPDGPRELADVLADVDDTYFPTRQAFVAAVRDAVGQGPVATED
jgi:hypothetical protein